MSSEWRSCRRHRDITDVLDTQILTQENIVVLVNVGVTSFAFVFRIESLDRRELELV